MNAKLIDILPAHRFDIENLRRYLQHIGLEGVADTFEIKQFQGGQSNPTFLITAGTHRYVLRKKPPGKLLPSAHQIEREYQVISALRDTGVPVAPARHLCEDPSIIGTPFYVMDYVEGRIFPHPALKDIAREQRHAIYREMAETLAKLHAVDWKAVGLEGFGRPDHYVERQIKRWSQQYEASKTSDIPAMEQLIRWLPEHAPSKDETSIVHGDYRLGNLIYHPSEPKILAILDWELSTLGHPLSDLAYCCLMYHLPADTPALKGLVGMDITALGIPDEAEFLSFYCAQSGRTDIPDWDFFLAFSLFRLAAILQGIYARALQGNASSADAHEVGARAGILAEIGWKIAQRGGAR